MLTPHLLSAFRAPIFFVPKWYVGKIKASASVWLAIDVMSLTLKILIRQQTLSDDVQQFDLKVH